MENQESPFKAGLNSGLILGIISVVITYILYFIDPTLLVAWYVGIGILVLYFGLIIYFGGQYRSSIGGFMTFGTAFNFAFVAMVVSGIISMLGSLLLYNVVDPALPGVLIESQMETQMAMLEKFGAADAMTSEQIDDIRTSLEGGYTVLGQVKAFGFLLIAYAIIALILGAILKKRDKSLDY
ncbi:DUF4199 domain-containing protein [Cognataquiflexum rubidum]|uniref:DUF4199 domain-containing protein n=1 Tax=Cognataquiflexum rubidum TaxID=2922273 RepID=UPI001F14226D|nr:DUF4199 domain-containing protein [Cognataquiflexum rubidum]MCH6234787.1 DUF4199 domain-containing protein [Cognataquiflexum rubidum]